MSEVIINVTTKFLAGEFKRRFCPKWSW